MFVGWEITWIIKTKNISSTYLANMITGTWAECAKREVEHYYKLRQKKHEVASNIDDPCSGGSKKSIEKRWAENDKN